MNVLIGIIFFILGICLLLVLFYLYFLAIVSVWPQKRKNQEYSLTIKFAIVIPAHNESPVIQRTLNSLKQVHYPENLYDIFVIADNCDDNTAEVVRKTGITCWERIDPTHHGKGHVLKWAFERLLKEGDHVAYIIIDADTLTDKAFLKAMNQKVMEGAKALQGYYDVLHPERSPMGSLSYLGFVLSRNFRFKGRTRIGWTSNLLGNGMCFTREVIQKFGWCATSIVEDIEYEMFLLMNGIKVVFVPEARIYAEIPDTFSKSKIQRGRWDTGKFEVRNKYLPKLICEGIRKKDFSYFDAAMELLIPPFSIFVILLLACASLFFVIDFKGPNFNFFIWTSVISSLMIYIMGGLLIARASFKIYLSLLYAPFFILWRFWLIIQETWYRKHKVWIKTERKKEITIK